MPGGGKVADQGSLGEDFGAPLQVHSAKHVVFNRFPMQQNPVGYVFAVFWVLGGPAVSYLPNPGAPPPPFSHPSIKITRVFVNSVSGGPAPPWI